MQVTLIDREGTATTTQDYRKWSDILTNIEERAMHVPGAFVALYVYDPAGSPRLAIYEIDGQGIVRPDTAANWRLQTFPEA
jgi:hypothetical protein